MATTKKPKKSKAATRSLEDAYWESVLERGQVPASVYHFCKEQGVEEAEFFRQYGSFEAIEKNFWAAQVKETIDVVDADPESAGYDARQLLLAFYFTFFEGLLNYRSRFLLRFPHPADLRSDVLAAVRREFDPFAERVIAKGREEGSIAKAGPLDKLIDRGLWPQFLFLLDFHKRDSSAGCEDTDALIEKSVRLFFEASRLPVFEAALDLVKFLVPKMRGA